MALACLCLAAAMILVLGDVHASGAEAECNFNLRLMSLGHLEWDAVDDAEFSWTDLILGNVDESDFMWVRPYVDGYRISGLFMGTASSWDFLADAQVIARMPPAGQAFQLQLKKFNSVASYEPLMASAPLEITIPARGTPMVTPNAENPHRINIATDGWFNAICVYVDGVLVTDSFRPFPFVFVENGVYTSSFDISSAILGLEYRLEPYEIQIRVINEGWGWAKSELSTPISIVYMPQEAPVSDVSAERLVDYLPISGKTFDTGLHHALAIDENGVLWAWGRNDRGQLGNGTLEDSPVPVRIMDDVVVVAAGMLHSMAITSDGVLWAWGRNDRGQIGDGTYIYRSSPVKVMENVAFVATSNHNSAVITNDGVLWVWGENGQRQLGLHSNERRELLPMPILDDIVYVSVMSGTFLALTADDRIYYWGFRNSFPIMYNNPDDRVIETPQEVWVGGDWIWDYLFVPNYWSGISLGDSYAMLITRDGRLLAVGSDNNMGRGLGRGSINSSFGDAREVMRGIFSVQASRGRNTAAITNNGDLYIWGPNRHGQIGDGTYTSYEPIDERSSRIAVDNQRFYPTWVMDSVVDVSLGGDGTAAFTIALREDGSLWAWGNNDFGQFGNGTTDNSLLPVMVMDGIKMPQILPSFTPASEIPDTVELRVRFNVSPGRRPQAETHVVDLYGLIPAHANPHRITAIDTRGNRIGGVYDTETGLFTFESRESGNFTIAYVEDLTRIHIDENNLFLIDLAQGNFAMTYVPTFVQDGQLMVPICAVGQMLGADVFIWMEQQTVEIIYNWRRASFDLTRDDLGWTIPARFLNNRVFVPVSVVAAHFGMVVNVVDGGVQFVK